jgi:hypothetical protein
VRAAMLTLAVALLLCPSLFADRITLKNGDRLTGAIEKSDEKTLLIKTELEGEVTVQWSAIDTIQSDQPLHVGLSGGQTLVGPVSTSDGQVKIATKDAGTVVTTLEAIRLIRSDAEQAAYDARMERLQHPHLTDFWGGYLDTGLSVTRGNSQTLSFVLSGKAVRKSPRDTIIVYANSIFANNSNTGTTITTANAIGGGVRMDLNVSDRTFVFGLADFQHDEFQQLDLRSLLGGGFGYHAIKTEATTFDVYGGGAYDQAFYSTPLTIRSGVVNVGLQPDKVQRTFRPVSQPFPNGRVSFPAQSWRHHRSQFLAGLAGHLHRRLRQQSAAAHQEKRRALQHRAAPDVRQRSAIAGADSQRTTRRRNRAAGKPFHAGPPPFFPRRVY